MENVLYVKIVTLLPGKEMGKSGLQTGLSVVPSSRKCQLRIEGYSWRKAPDVLGVHRGHTKKIVVRFRLVINVVKILGMVRNVSQIIPG